MTMSENITELSNIDSDDFWLNAKSQLIFNQIKIKGAKILDVGCGTGSLSFNLALKGHCVDAIDISENSINKTNIKMQDTTLFNNKPNVWLSTIELLEYTGKYDYIILADILEHIEDDKKILNKAFKLLKNDGKLIISVPAIKMLYGTHDIYCEHIRRYSKNEICSKLIDSGFEIVVARYWNLLLIPVAFFFSKILKKSYPHSTVNSIKIFNKMLELYYTNFENKVNVPIGMSLFIVASKKLITNKVME